MRTLGPLLMFLTRPGCRARAALGGFVWLAFTLATLPGWAEALLLLGPLVVLPLGLALLLPRDADPGATPLRGAAGVQLPAALPLLGAVILPAGPVAAALALPWLGFTLVLAVAGLARLWPRVPKSAAEIGFAAALLFPAVGGGWLVLSALGARPLGFTPEIVRATAIHFHYAGFALPLLAGLTASVRPGLASRVVCAGVVTGVPLVALGITLSAFGVRLPEWLAAWFLAAVCAVLAGQQAGLASRPRPGRLLLAVSGLSLLLGMGLAALYAWGTYWGPAWLDIPLMLRTHGAINALGFALPGLLAWNLAADGWRAEARREEAMRTPVEAGA
jgi:hypothetical protein